MVMQQTMAFFEAICQTRAMLNLVLMMDGVIAKANPLTLPVLVLSSLSHNHAHLFQLTASKTHLTPSNKA
jgi:hypothetical protein